MCTRGIQRALRCVRKFLRGRKKCTVAVRLEDVAWKNCSIRIINESRSHPVYQRLQEAYLDESYIHEHYAQVNGSIYDPADDEYAEPKGKHKGGRYHFIVFIKGPGQSSTPGIIPESL